MTKKEIYDAERDNPGSVILYPEGKFYKAYERSAWALCSRVHPFKVSCRWVSTIGDFLVSVGFPIESLDKWSGGGTLSELPDGAKRICFGTLDDSLSSPFNEWKQRQIDQARERTQREEDSAKGGDSALRLYGASYRLALELSKDSALLQKNYRYSLGEQLRMASFRLCLDVESAGLSAEKVTYVSKAVDGIREVQLCLRMLTDIGALPDKRFVYYMEMTSDISKQLHNWKKSLTGGK